ncbi:MAG: hypothetical protein Q4C60_02070 [Eubacteriales bacterium]|nr:hypothetical protein [Eubacteriales bacterium]
MDNGIIVMTGVVDERYRAARKKMQLFNRQEVEEIVKGSAALIGDGDRVPEEIVIYYFGAGTVEAVKKKERQSAKIAEKAGKNYIHTQYTGTVYTEAGGGAQTYFTLAGVYEAARWYNEWTLREIREEYQRKKEEQEAQARGKKRQAAGSEQGNGKEGSE